MFNFDGDFRRRPQQNLGGASSQKSDRLTIIRKAQQERQKREDARRQQNGAVVIQSSVRSFVQRQNVKRRERERFDEHRKKLNGTIESLEDLDFLTRRIVFFYQGSGQSKDGERLIFLCQYVVKNPKVIYEAATTQPMWIYRIKKLLGLCLEQMFAPDQSPAIPMRMLEIFSSNAYISRYLPQDNPQLARGFLESIFCFLIRQRYFRIVRQLIEEKIPAPDEDTATIQNPIADALLQMLIRPLKLLPTNNATFDKSIMQSFVFHILSPEFSRQIRYYILPALANSDEFPYTALIRYLAEEYQSRLDYQNTILIDIDDEMDGSVFSGNLGSGSSSKKPRKNFEKEILDLTSFLLYSVMRLGENKLDKIDDEQLYSEYVKVLSSMVSNIMKLPRVTIETYQNRQDDSSDSESESDDVQMLNSMENRTLTEAIGMFNDNDRVSFIVQHVDNILDNPAVVQHLCLICHNLMTYNRLAVYEYKLLYMLASKPQFVRSLWYTLTAQTASQGFSSPISLLSKGLTISKYDSDRIVPILASFCALFGRLIATLHDGEFCQENVLPGTVSKIMPFTIAEIIPLSTTLKEISLGLVELAFPETRSSLKDSYRTMLTSLNNESTSHYRLKCDRQNEQSKNVWPHLMKVCVSLLRQIHTRDLRRGFCPEGHWTAQNLNLPLDKPTDLHLSRGRRGPRPFQPIRDFTREDAEDGPPLSTKQIRSITILREIPFVVAFNTRVGVFQGLVAADKLRTQGDLQGFLQGPSIQLTVRRSHLYEDAFDKLSPINEPDLRPKLRIEMVNSVGMREAGIDGGGVFREFLSELIKTAFDPHRGFFMITKDNMLYPNPSVSKIVEDYQRHYYFIGRILGKALYENLLVELPLAEFFLSKLAGKHSDVDIHQLASLDPVLHRNLMSLKAYEGDVSELGLDFTIVCDELGETRIEELKPNGANITVNSSNRLEYIQLMADFKLNKQIRWQCLAFRQGLANVLPIEWLYMFSNKELQVLTSGAEIPVDVNDLRINTRYGGDFTLEHETIQLFWKVVEEFDDIQRRQLLKFVTSCSRPPLLGFKDLDPPFCIQNAGDTDRLPSASTCMNLLKLPAFQEEGLLREKLLYAIQSGAGFELS
ncbi:ubiquitin-protein ligase E3C [Uranotaenia lowii]|uniref:ubiquitin-protein ligase E3C n=1 Tax=Uranotaenia lowii TaxID=190385 RepID=UPI002478DB7F|nr:ubiquitin-protein ligase E3C [Uranotaenia lowii]